MEFQCRVIVQRRFASCCRSVENIPLQAERHFARRQKLFAFPPESAFTFRPECCSESQRNRVRFQSGIAFTFDRIPHSRTASLSFRPNSVLSFAVRRLLLARINDDLISDVNILTGQLQQLPTSGKLDKHDVYLQITVRLNSVRQTIKAKRNPSCYSGS